jgi:hypothetical protein
MPTGAQPVSKSAKLAGALCPAPSGAHETSHIASASSQLEQGAHKEIQAHRGIRGLHLGDPGLARAHSFCDLGLRQALTLPGIPQPPGQGELRLDELLLLRSEMEELGGVADAPAGRLKPLLLLRLRLSPSWSHRSRNPASSRASGLKGGVLISPFSQTRGLGCAVTCAPGNDFDFNLREQHAERRL